MVDATLVEYAVGPNASRKEADADDTAAVVATVEEDAVVVASAAAATVPATVAEDKAEATTEIELSYVVAVDADTVAPVVVPNVAVADAAVSVAPAVVLLPASAKLKYTL